MNRLQIKNKFKHRPLLTVSEFSFQIALLYENDKRVKIKEADLVELIRKGIIISNDKQLIPSFELIRLHPDELLDAQQFMSNAGLTETELEKAISTKEIEAVTIGNKMMIRKNELRRYLKTKGLQMVYNIEDLFRLLDELFEENAIKWNDETFSSRERTADFLVNDPDENLVGYVENLKVPMGDVLEFGCGHGRNAVYMAKNNSRVDAFDMAPAGIAWANEYAATQQVAVNFGVSSIYDLRDGGSTYDFIYDHGCFHHQPPHRRLSYVELAKKKLRKNGHLSIVFFNKVVSDHTDMEMYRSYSTKEGVPYAEEQIMKIFGASFDIIEYREMENHHVGKYGRSYLSTVLMRKKD